jgi:hypothetical protein
VAHLLKVYDIQKLSNNKFSKIAAFALISKISMKKATGGLPVKTAKL